MRFFRCSIKKEGETMAIRTSRSWILAIGATGLFLPISVCGGGDTQVARKSDETTAFRMAVLERFDANHNGRLDSKEQTAATRALVDRNNTDEGLTALREQILARFDKNGNGKLERQEIRTALASVNAKSRATRRAQSTETAETTETASNRGATAAAIARDPEAPLVFVAQQLMSTGMDAETAQAFAVQKLDLNGDGVVDQSELAVAQAALLQQLTQLNATTSTPLSTAATASTGTTSTGTGTSTTSGSGGMSGGCGSGSTGTTGSGTTGSGTTTGSTQASTAQAASTRAFGNLNSARSSGPGGISFRRGR
jgi:Ca2+-binding EF-hand superfamily protein